jgi:hypothetical protein
MKEYPHNLNGNGSIKLSMQPYIIIFKAKLVSILILPPFKPSAINLTPKN